MSFKDKIFKNQSPWGSPPGGGGGRRQVEMDQAQDKIPQILMTL